MQKKKTKKIKPAFQTSVPQALTQTATNQDHAAAVGVLFGPAPTQGKKKDEQPFNRKEEIARLSQNINNQYKGKAVVRMGSDITNVFILRRPTGVTTLDLSLGGGIPAGGLTQIIGRYSSGKSYLANRVMAVAQENYGEDFAACACMTEMRFDKRFAKEKCGLRVGYSEDEISVFQKVRQDDGLPPYTVEEMAWLRDSVGTFEEVVASTAEQLLEIAVQKIESNLFQVVLIDSFGALLTAAEAEAEEGLEQKHRGGAAMVVTQFMHRLHAALNLPDRNGRPNTTTVLGINQYRDNVGAGLYGNPMKVAGGHALAHGKLVDIHVEQGARLRTTVGTQQIIIGKEINWEILKGKAGCHDGPKGTYSFYFGERGCGFGVDICTDLMVAGLQAGVIEQSGAWYSFRSERLGQGKENAAQAIYQSPQLLQTIRQEIFKSAGLSFITRSS
jgi:recombination protein RecA